MESSTGRHPRPRPAWASIPGDVSKAVLITAGPGPSVHAVWVIAPCSQRALGQSPTSDCPRGEASVQGLCFPFTQTNPVSPSHILQPAAQRGAPRGKPSNPRVPAPPGGRRQPGLQVPEASGPDPVLIGPLSHLSALPASEPARGPTAGAHWLARAHVAGPERGRLATAAWTPWRWAAGGGGGGQKSCRTWETR